MRLDAVGVFSSNLSKTVAFYTLLGFEFPEFKDNEQHVEAITGPGSTRLMIDTAELVESLIGEKPKAGNCSVFAIKYDLPDEVNEVTEKISKAGFKVVKEPWDAFWGQRYAVVEDLDGHRVDLFAALSS